MASDPTIGRSLAASTENKWLTEGGGPLDCAYAGTPVLDTLRETGKRQTARGATQQKSAFRLLSGGKFIQDAPILNKSDASTNITGDDVVTPRGHDPLEEALWPWCMKVRIPTINEYDDMRNSGPQAKVAEWQTRLTEQMSGMLYDINYDICARDSLTGASSYTGVNGLPALIDIEGTSDTKAVGGITRASTVPGWLNQGTKTCGAFSTNFGIKFNLQMAVCEGATKGGVWNLIMAPPTTWNYMQTYLLSKGQVQFQQDKEPNPAYRKFMWGAAKVCTEDQDLTAGYIYGLPTEDLWFATNTKHNFKIGEEYDAPQQFVKAKKMSWAGNFGFRRASGLGVTAGWTS